MPANGSKNRLIKNSVETRLLRRDEGAGGREALPRRTAARLPESARAASLRFRMARPSTQYPMSANDAPREIQDFHGGGAFSAMSTIEIGALVAFVGTIIFCFVQAVVAPRRTFCAQKAD